MPIRINSNQAFERSKTHFSTADRNATARREHLASGLRINSGADDGGRLGISEGMRAQIGGLTEGTRNAAKAIDLLQTAEGAMGEVSSILLRMRDISTESTTDTINDGNRAALDSEFNELKDFMDRIGKLTSYNGQRLLSEFGNTGDLDTSTAVTDSADTGVLRTTLASARGGTYTIEDAAGDGMITMRNGTENQTISLGSILDGDKVADGTTVIADFDSLGVSLALAGAGVLNADGSYTDGDLDGKIVIVQEGVGGQFQLGGEGVAADRIEYDIKEMTASDPVLNIGSISIGTRASSRLAVAQVDEAIDRVSRERGALGATVNRLQHTIGFSDRALEGVIASESTVRDADFALESPELARAQLLSDLSQSAMVQAGTPPNIALSLLTG